MYTTSVTFFDEAGYGDQKYYACGYGLGATYRPTWMDTTDTQSTMVRYLLKHTSYIYAPQFLLSCLHHDLLMFVTAVSCPFYLSLFQLSSTISLFSRVCFKRNPRKTVRRDKIQAYLPVGEKSSLLYMDSWVQSNDWECSTWWAADVERDTPPGRVPAFENSLFTSES